MVLCMHFMKCYKMHCYKMHVAFYSNMLNIIFLVQVVPNLFEECLKGDLFARLVVIASTYPIIWIAYFLARASIFHRYLTIGVTLCVCTYMCVTNFSKLTLGNFYRVFHNELYKSIF